MLNKYTQTPKEAFSTEETTVECKTNAEVVSFRRQWNNADLKID